MIRPLPPLGVLIVEDEGLIAMDIAAIVEDGGHRVVAEAASLHEVEELPDDLGIHLAFVDVQLARHTSGIDACRLVLERWPNTIVVFVTANPKKLPDDYAGAHGVIAKPFTLASLASAIVYIEEGVCRPPPLSSCPSAFFETPAFAATWAN